MGFKIKPNLDRYVPYPLSKGWGIMDVSTGEILKKKDHRHRIERYAYKAWVVKRCIQLNED